MQMKQFAVPKHICMKLTSRKYVRIRSNLFC